MAQGTRSTVARMVDRKARLGVTALRLAVASVFVIHGVTRATLGIVDDFGGFLSVMGLPAGVAIAWILTVVEILGGLALAAGFWCDRWPCGSASRSWSASRWFTARRAGSWSARDATARSTAC